MRLSVIGCGRWGTFLAWYLDHIGHEVCLYGRPQSEKMAQLERTRKNEYLTLPESVQLTDEMTRAMQNDTILVSVPSQSLRALMHGLQNYTEKIYVLCMKGIEIGTGKRLSEIVAEEAGARCRSAVWLGPGHAQDFLRGVPNCMVIDAEHKEDKERLVETFSSDLIRFYYGEDLIGNEIGAAAKNVVGIAAGMLDGFGLTSLKGPLMSRGTREVARLILALGGNELSAYGLCHLGDYEATVFSPHSHNHSFGLHVAQGREYTQLAEGYYTVRALMTLAGKHGVELPICGAVSGILYEDIPPQEALNLLFSRSLKQEFN
ncbi:NAD(P)H-dependent glycerol-3-phosphate dehydrogenase [Ruminococcaceae bacterium OttesenSCG-928-I18]|nr:NAD(P)H-dependent glycerol-3-phosphate dehydrogenase [Ruminococcaceae bacterium OttesenSCG-928-I18]